MEALRKRSAVEGVMRFVRDAGTSAWILDPSFAAERKAEGSKPSGGILRNGQASAAHHFLQLFRVPRALHRDL
jgi:hypothetical protein